jgi:hypothetical protein
MILPQEIINKIYEFNSDHRVLMREVMKELLWEMSEVRLHSYFLYMIQDEFSRYRTQDESSIIVLCKNCNERKQAMNKYIKYCSSTCFNQYGRNNLYKLS